MKIVWFGKERRTKEGKKAKKKLGGRMIERVYENQPKLKREDRSPDTVTIGAIGKEKSTSKLMEKLLSGKKKIVSPAVAKLEKEKKRGKKVFM